MIAFGIILIILFLFSLFGFKSDDAFSKQKTLFLKVFMDVAIILGHLSCRVPSGWIQPFRFWGAPFVSMFLFISGYGMWQSFLSNYGLSFSSTLKRIWKIVLPYLFTVLLYFAIVRLPSRELNIDVLEAIMTGTSKQSHLWFVFAIIYLYLTFFLCTRLRRRSAIILSLFAITALTIAFLRKVGYDRCWWVSLMAFPTGCLYSMYKDRINDAIFKNRLRYCLAMAAAIVGVGVSYLPGVEVLYSISHIFIPMAIALVVIQLPIEKLNNRFTMHLGSISYEIYLCQLIAMDALQLFFSSMPPAVYVLCTVVLTVLLAELVSFASHKVFAFGRKS